MEKNNSHIQIMDDIQIYMEESSPTQPQPEQKIKPPQKQVHFNPQQQVNTATRPNHVSLLVPLKKVEEVRIPPNYSAYAWFTCIFCNFAVGMYAIWKSGQVDKAIQKGNYKKAEAMARSTKFLICIAIGLGLISYCLAIAFLLNEHA